MKKRGTFSPFFKRLLQASISKSACLILFGLFVITTCTSHAQLYNLGAFWKAVSGNYATPVLIQTGTNNGTSVSSLVITISSSTSGNLLVVGYANNDTTCTITGITDNAGNTYVSAAARSTDSACNGSTEVWYASNIIAGATSVTVTQNKSCNPSVWVEEFSNINTVSPLDNKAVLNSQSTNTVQTAPTVSTGTTHSAVLSVADSCGGVTGIHAGNPFTALTIQNGDDVAKYIAPSAGTYGAVWDAGGGTYSMSTAAFKAAGPLCGNISLVQSVPGTSLAQNMVNQASQSKAITLTAGNTLVAFVYAGQGSPGGVVPNMKFTVTDTLGNTFYAGPFFYGKYNNAAVQIFYAPNVVSGVDNVTASSTGSQLTNFWTGVLLQEYSGLAATVAADVASGQAAPSSTGTVTPGNMTTTQACDLVVAAFADGNVSGQTVKGGPGWAVRSSDFWDPAVAVDNSPVGVTAGSVVNAVMNISSDDGWVATQMALRSASGTFAALQPTKLGFPNGPLTVPTWTCSPLVIQTQNGASAPTVTSNGTSGPITTTAGVGMYADPSCVYPITGARIGAGTNAQTVYFSGPAGSPQISFTTNSAGLIQHQNTQLISNTNNIQMANFPNNVTSGNLLVCTVFYANTGTNVINLSDTGGNAYAKAIGPTVGGGVMSSWNSEIWYSYNVTGGANFNITANFASTFAQEKDIVCTEFSGVATGANPFDVANSSAGASGTNSATGNVTTNFTDELLYASSIVSSSTSASAGWGFTSISNFQLNQFEAKTVSLAGVYAGTFNHTTGDWVDQIATFKTASQASYTQTETITGVNSFTWIGGAGCDQNWSTGACWQGGAAPNSTQTAHFDSTCSTNCSPTLSANTTVGGLWLHTGYSGSVNQSTFNLTTSNFFTIDGGTFNGGTGTLTDNGPFTINNGGTFNATSGAINFNLVGYFNGGSFTSTSGTLTMNGAPLITNGAPNFWNNGGTVVFTGASWSSLYILPGDFQFKNVSFTSSNSAIYNISGTLYVNGDLTVNSGDGTAHFCSTGSATISVRGNVYATNGASDGGGCGGGNTTLAMEGVTNQSITGGTNSLPGNITINNSGGGGSNIVTLLNTVYANGWTYNQGALNSGTSTVNFFGQCATVSDSVSTFNNVTSSVTSSTCGLTITGTLNVAGNFNINHDTSARLNGGTLSLAGNLTLTQSNSGGTAKINFVGGGAQTYTYVAGSLPNGNFTVNKTAGTTLTLNSAMSVNAAAQTFTITSGILDLNGNGFNPRNLVITDTLTAGSGSITLGGNWTNNGTFNANTGNVSLTSANHTFVGNTTFYNLAMTATGVNRTLTFPAGGTQTVTNIFSVTGGSTSKCLLRSSTAGTQWNLTPPAGTTLGGYVDVKDSNSSVAIHSGANFVNSGNNTNWIFP